MISERKHNQKVFRNLDNSFGWYNSFISLQMLVVKKALQKINNPIAVMSGTIFHTSCSEVLVILHDTRLLLVICYAFPASVFYVLCAIFHICLVKHEGNSLSTEVHCETKARKSWISALTFLWVSLFMAPIGTFIWEINVVTNTTSYLIPEVSLYLAYRSSWQTST